MTWDGVQERRRTPRVDVPDAFECRFEMRVRVRLIDISASGVLLQSDAALPVETEGELKAVLATTRFSPNLQVRRTAPLTRNEGMQLGMVFVEMDDGSRQSLEAFLRKATS
jgi:c-di-GMP-binding flagellar brake protein YcgR